MLKNTSAYRCAGGVVDDADSETGDNANNEDEEEEEEDVPLYTSVSHR